MSVSVDGSTSAPVFVDGNVVQNVVGLGQENGLEGHLLSLGTGVDDGGDVGWGESFACCPLPVRVVEQLALIPLISVPQ